MANSSMALVKVPTAEDDDVVEAVKAELNRILSSPHFVDTSRMKRFLTYVVDETLAGRANLIKGYTLGIEVFDRPENFDPQADTIVRVQAGQLRRRLDLYYSTLGQSNPVRIVIPKGAYVPKFEIRETRSVTPLKSSEPLAKILPIEQQKRPGIAVLTFQNLTVNGEDSYFAEGLTIELVNALVQFRYLRIVARSASIHRGGLSTDLNHLAEHYGVQFVLTGTVRKVKDLIRVSVDLISTETGDHIYTKIFDRKCTPDNLFEIQEEIASYLAANVGAPFGAVHRYNRRDNRGRRASMAGYNAILKYYEMNVSPSVTKAMELLDLTEGITKTNPRFSSAWAVQSLLQTYLVSQAVNGNNHDKRLKVALRNANRATAIDPENALAFMAKFSAEFHSGDIEAFRKSAMTAIALNPFDHVILAYYAAAMAHLGDFEEAYRAQNAAMSLVAWPPKWFFMTMLLDAIRKGQYEIIADHFKQMEPATAAAWVLLYGVSCFGHLGQQHKADDLIKELKARNENFEKPTMAAFLRWNPSADLKKSVIDGCRKAGLELKHT